MSTDILLIIFIHGFKGNHETTFGEFPSRIQNVISRSLPHTIIESLVYPTYDTRGNLDLAVDKLCEWLVEIVTIREAEQTQKRRHICKAKIILCGHSMGGIIGAEAILNFIKDKNSSNSSTGSTELSGLPFWPNICGLIAFDTPFYGVHPHVVSHQVNKAADMFGKLSTAISLIPAITTLTSNKSSKSSKSWGKWGLAAGVGMGFAAAAAETVAYIKRDEINLSQGISWITSHLEFVSILFKDEELKNRMNNIIKLTPSKLFKFHCFFTTLSEKSQTFIVLPTNENMKYFSSNQNNLAENQIDAHCDMFNASKNPGYYNLGNETVSLILEAIQ